MNENLNGLVNSKLRPIFFSFVKLIIWNSNDLQILPLAFAHSIVKIYAHGFLFNFVINFAQ